MKILIFSQPQPHLLTEKTYYNTIEIMVAGTVSHEIQSPISPSRFWNAIVKDSHNLMPKLMPEIITSIVILEGDGGVGTIRQSNFTDAIKDFSYWKDRIDEIDNDKHLFKYSVIEGGLLGKKVKSTTFTLEFKGGIEGGSICKFHGEFETVEGSVPKEDETKEMMGNMVGMFKAVEGYLVANPNAYV
ncbi:pathogenesis-related protein 1-like [Magnolia sinica]|uniref:pathogenesis-related protein 1-like n=1 Tax=Magnolia sinica TaxID=86752 RepID=UPI00265ABD91|nr:pathogenesis-related protein 1-like [Magnolia sinica]